TTLTRRPGAGVPPAAPRPGAASPRAPRAPPARARAAPRVRRAGRSRAGARAARGARDRGRARGRPSRARAGRGRRHRPRGAATRLAAAEQRRADELEEVLLLAGRQPARDPLPEVPPFRPALDGARMAQLARQHAPEAADAHLVAGVAEARPEKESGQVQPPC